MTLSTSDAIDKAIELLNRFGWVQKDSRFGGPYCLAGVLEAGEVGLSRHLLCDHIRESIVKHMGNLDCKGFLARVFEWNDTPGRTKEEVIDLLLKVKQDIETIDDGKSGLQHE